MYAIKSSAYILISTLLKMLNGLFIIKILTYYTNPSEFGYLSQLMGAIALAGMLASGGINNGLTRYLSASTNKMTHYRWLIVAMKIYLPISLLIAVFLILYSSQLAIWLLDDVNFKSIFLYLAVGQILVGYSTLAQSAAMALKNHIFILQITIIATLLGAIVVFFAVYWYGMLGAASALVLNASIAGIVGIIFKRQLVISLTKEFFAKVDNQKKIQLLKYAAVVLLGASSLTISQIANRNLVAQSFGWEAVGLWQAITKISDSYMQIISVFLISLVLPKLASYKNIREMNSFFLKICIIFSTLFITSSFFIYFFRHIIIKILFSDTYLSAENLLLPQLIGDFFRMLAVCFSTALLACEEIKVSMLYEGLQGILTLAFTFIIIKHTNLVAPIYAYGITYGVLMLFLSHVYFSRLRQIT